ncbi:unnamed protein product [Closterium sp. Naga37s-1]|nr:unnamed protein product [Closterium sp. Naga37s-1]
MAAAEAAEKSELAAKSAARRAARLAASAAAAAEGRISATGEATAAFARAFAGIAPGVNDSLAGNNAGEQDAGEAEREAEEEDDDEGSEWDPVTQPLTEKPILLGPGEFVRPDGTRGTLHGGGAPGWEQRWRNRRAAVKAAYGGSGGSVGGAASGGSGGSGWSSGAGNSTASAGTAAAGGATFSIAGAAGAAGDTLVQPMAGTPDISHTAGYFKIKARRDTRLFYYYFESRNDASTDPLVLWLTGGPGCSSAFALLYENGPYQLDTDGTTLIWNDNGWDMASNIIFLDQPVGTGFSYSNDGQKRSTQRGVSKDAYQFLQAFLDAHPELRTRPFFITGESYAGKYIPTLAARIVRANKVGKKPRINLQGMAIGNGLTSPHTQSMSYARFAYRNKLMSYWKYRELKARGRACQLTDLMHPGQGDMHYSVPNVRAGGTRSCHSLAVSTCVSLLPCLPRFSPFATLPPLSPLACPACLPCFPPLPRSPLLHRRHPGQGDVHYGVPSYYDVRKPCVYDSGCYDFSAGNAYLNSAEVKQKLGVKKEWRDCDDNVYFAMLMDFERDETEHVRYVLNNGLRVLIYAGEKDFICNWIGNSWWLRSLKWKDQGAYRKAKYKPFLLAGSQKGLAKIAEPLTFLRYRGRFGGGATAGGTIGSANSGQTGVERLEEVLDVNLPLPQGNHTNLHGGSSYLYARKLTPVTGRARKADTPLASLAVGRMVHDLFHDIRTFFGSLTGTRPH